MKKGFFNAVQNTQELHMKYRVSQVV